MTGLEILIIQVFLMVLIVFLEIIHFKERKDLYNRIMAKDLTEYSAHKVQERKAEIPQTVKSEYLTI